MNSPETQKLIKEVFDEWEAMPKWKLRLKFWWAGVRPGFWGRALHYAETQEKYPPLWKRIVRLR